MSLTETAKRLRNAQIDRIIAPFRETRAARRRVVMLLCSVVWAYQWAHVTTNPELHEEAVRALPYAMALFTLSLVWWIVFSTQKLADHDWTDVVGTVLEFSSIGVMLLAGWNLMLPIVAMLPLACISAGARYNTRVFWVAEALSLLLVFLNAPPGYWASRPVVAVLAVILVAGFPFTVNRILKGLREVSEEAILAQAAQSRFLAMMSHELRTPLNTVINAAGLVDVDLLKPDQQSLLKAITVNANVLLSRVNDTLDVAAIDGGQFYLSNAAFDFRAVMDTVREVVESEGTRKGVSIAYAIDESIPEVLIGDAHRIEQVISNLAANAVKYTESMGFVRIHATNGGHDSSNVTVIIKVSDSGIGIPDAHKERIFEPFHQVSRGDSRSYDGVGLGLHIVRTISDRMHGQLSVEDNRGGGTVFTWMLSLPIAATGQQALSQFDTLELLRRHRAVTPPLRCLVIDDSQSNREIMGRILEQAGHEAHFATEGENGLRMIRQLVAEQAVDIVFLDLHMPKQSGWDVLAAVRADPSIPPSLNIVIVSAVTDAASLRRAWSFNVTRYLSKPMSVPELLKTLEDINNPSLMTQRPSKSKTALAKPLGLDMMRELSSPPVLQSYIAACIEDIQTSLDALDAAVLAGDREQARESAHRLKGVFLGGGMPGPVNVCSAALDALDVGDDITMRMAELRSFAHQAIAMLRQEQAGAART